MITHNTESSAPPSGIILCNKPCGITSFDFLYAIKKKLGTKKVGHTGTLDKFANGLMIVLAGRALKLSQYFTHADKRYEAEIFFGAETDTLDPEGKIIAVSAPPEKEDILEKLPQFTGSIEQKPPAYSALHINGKRAHEIARAGNMPEMQARPVTVYKIELCAFTKSADKKSAKALVYIECSSGTYIRSLARDIALAASSRAHLSALCRTNVAGFHLTEATGELLPISENIFEKINIPSITVDKATMDDMIHGKNLQRIFNGCLPKEAITAVFSEKDFITLIKNDGTGILSYA